MPANDNLSGRALTNDEVAMSWAIETARNSVRGGYESYDEAIDSVQVIIDEDDLDVSAEALVDTEIQSLKEEQKSWPLQGDFEKLILVFEKLEADGIFSVDNLGYCQTTGISDLLELVESYEVEGGDSSDMHGYTFFHKQDVNSAIDGEGLYLCYGNFPVKDDPEAAVEVGKQVAKRLLEAGFYVNWNENLSARIHVPIKWRRRWAG